MGLSSRATKKANAVEGAVSQTVEIGCDVSAAVNDLVRISTTTPDMVDVSTDNLDSRVVVGIIKEKLSDTRCVIFLSGVIDDPDATTQGIIWLSATGRFTSTPPVLNYQQKLGFSFGNGKLDFKPDKTHVNRT